MCVSVCVCVCVYRVQGYPLTQKGREGRVYIAQNSRNSIAVVGVMRMGGGYKGMLDSYTHTNK